MQFIVYWVPQRPGSDGGGQPPSAGLACLKHIQNHNFSTFWPQKQHEWMLILQRH